MRFLALSPDEIHRLEIHGAWGLCEGAQQGLSRGRKRCPGQRWTAVTVVEEPALSWVNQLDG